MAVIRPNLGAAEAADVEDREVHAVIANRRLGVATSLSAKMLRTIITCRASQVWKSRWVTTWRHFIHCLFSEECEGPRKTLDKLLWHVISFCGFYYRFHDTTWRI